MKNKFFTFIEPVLDCIDNGYFFRQPFHWLYTVIAVLNLLLPFYLLFKAFDFFEYADGKMIAAFILGWLVLCGVAWFAFQLWWNRKERIYLSANEKDDFVAIPVFSHFLQTAGECAGLYVGVCGAALSLIATLFTNDYIGMLPGLTGLGVAGIVVFPIAGFLIVVASRVLAEMYRALAAIANNTKKK
jgi:hypothetical protein